MYYNELVLLNSIPEEFDRLFVSFDGKEGAARRSEPRQADT